MVKQKRLAVRGRMDKQGRIVVPSAIRRALGFEPEEPLTLMVEGKALHIITLDQAIKNAQAITRKQIGDRTGMVDEFLRERREDSGD